MLEPNDYEWPRVPSVAYYMPDGLPKAHSDAFDEDHPGSRGHPDADRTSTEQRFVPRTLAGGTLADHFVTVGHLSELASLLGFVLPGLDAQTQTDFSEGDEPHEPNAAVHTWQPCHCWSINHQSGLKAGAQDDDAHGGWLILNE